MKHYSQLADFANLDFEAIDTEILADKTKEKEGETIVDATKSDVLPQVELWMRLTWTKATLRRSSVLLERRFLITFSVVFLKTLVASFFEALT